MTHRPSILAAALLALCLTLAAADYWPQFQGPRRDNRSPDTGLLTQWPEGGPPLIWRAQGIGEGFASVAIVDGRIYTAGNIEADTVITALDLTGQFLWQRTNGPAYRRSHPGARSTPTIVGHQLYHLNGDGDVICLDLRTQTTIWTVNILRQFHGRTNLWGLAESLLVDGRSVIATPGGESAGMVALDKDTGATRWTCAGIGDAPGYVSPILVDHAGLRQVITLTTESVIGVAADTGRLLWKYPHPVRYGAVCTTPVYQAGHVYVFGTYGLGATRLKLNVDGTNCSVEKVWHTVDLDNEHGGVMPIDGYLYGQADGNHKKRYLACVEMATGRTMWTAYELAGRASATQTFAEGLLYIMNDRGEVALVRPNPQRLEILSQFQLPKDGRGEFWARPVVCGGRLYLRHGEFLYAYDIKTRL